RHSACERHMKSTGQYGIVHWDVIRRLSAFAGNAAMDHASACRFARVVRDHDECSRRLHQLSSPQGGLRPRPPVDPNHSWYRLSDWNQRVRFVVQTCTNSRHSRLIELQQMMPFDHRKQKAPGCSRGAFHTSDVCLKITAASAFHDLRMLVLTRHSWLRSWIERCYRA